jgi:hypothetical protein
MLGSEQENGTKDKCIGYQNSEMNLYCDLRK